MRWNDLFGDLEGQFASAKSAEFEAEVAEVANAERASVDLAARIRQVGSQPVVVHVEGGGVLRGTVVDVTPAWILVHEGPRDHLIPFGAIAGVEGVSDRSLPWTEVERRLTLGHALRILQNARVRVVVETGGGEFRGTITTVGADHCDIILELVDACVTVPFTALRRVTST